MKAVNNNSIEKFLEKIRNLSDTSREIFIKMYQLDDRPENKDIGHYPSVDFARENNRELQEIHEMLKKDKERQETLVSAAKQAVNLFLSKVIK